MSKYKVLLFFVLGFALGFILAAGIGIYRQEKASDKANEQIAIANDVIADLRNRQKEFDSLKIAIRYERILFEQEKSSFQLEIQNLQDTIDTIASQSEQECPARPACPACPACPANKNTCSSDVIKIKESQK